MNNQFVANGEHRLLKGRNAQRFKIARARYAEEWARAGYMKQLWLRLLIHLEAEDQKPEIHQPSPKTLW